MPLNFITFFSIFNLVAFSLTLLIKKESFKTGLWISAICMLIIAYTQLVVYLYYTGNIEKYWYLAYSETIVFYLFPPLLYFYILRFVDQLPKISIKHLSHFLVCVPGLLYYLVFLFESPEDRLVSIRTDYCGPLPDYLLNYTGLIIQMFYIYLSIKKIVEYKKYPDLKLSDFKKKKVNRIYFLLIYLGVLCVLFLIIIRFSENQGLTNMGILFLLNLLFLFFYIMQIMGHIRIVTTYDNFERTEVFSDLDIDKKKYRNISLAEEEIEILKTRLNQLYKKDHVCLNPDLTLAQLSDKLNTSPYKLSFVLNKYYSKTFHEYINYHRILKAIELLSVNKGKRLKLDVIAFECGFNSRSSFYAAFKKATGHSPMKYLEEHTLEN